MKKKIRKPKYCKHLNGENCLYAISYMQGDGCSGCLDSTEPIISHFLLREFELDDDDWADEE